MKHQIIAIHGGSPFDSYEEYLAHLRDRKIDWKQLKTKIWRENISSKLGKNFEVIEPKMPNKNNAKYLEWKIWFKKLIPFFDSEVVLIGHSLGGIFLAKYLAENKFPKKICGLFLVAAPFDSEVCKDTLGDFTLPPSLNKLTKQVDSIFLYQSKDDPIVPFADYAKYQKQLTAATPRIFTNRGHFSQEQLPEIVKDIRSLF
jgi:predicted alpha/beta hydrolase family esterase